MPGKGNTNNPDVMFIGEAPGAEEDAQGEPFVAVDAIGAGVGELVLISEGSAGRHTSTTTTAPVDAVIFAILDSLEVDGVTTFRKS